MVVRRLAGVLTAGCLFLTVGAFGASDDAGSSTLVGRRMFFGEMPLRGIITGHEEPLPPQMVSCANCHVGQGPATARAPFLNESMMTELRRRRGGPPSRFSETSFCRMLRTGVDPAYIVIARRMPRYTLSDDQCLGLWRYLMETGDEQHAK